ncbi:hypothetical protein DL769_003995 [Monosporascus sp. CRB-8-3]|nr:hypothetical protein DL769_003995 [Monosporascus sp. CRB-8-3]
MSGFATNELAVAVTRAGGLGQIGFTGNVQSLENELEQAQRKLRDTKLYSKTSKVLPVGIGMVAFDGSARPWIRTLTKYNPAMVWLSFGTAAEFGAWTADIRVASPSTKIWIQVGSVTAALEAAGTCQPDALVMQGNDAGGHGHRYGASIVTLIPEAADALEQRGLANIPLVAAGGIMDKRGAAAAIALGASGLVMGTRFLGCEEIDIDPEVVDEVLAASDGGQSTVRSRAFDDIWGTNYWPAMYDGRCLRNAIFDNIEGGMSIQGARHRLYNSSNSGSAIRDTHTIWAGTGVGMIKQREKASDIVNRIQEETRELIQQTADGLGPTAG